MGIFITQGNYTEQAMMGMIDNPEDRASAVAGLMDRSEQNSFNSM